MVTILKHEYENDDRKTKEMLEKDLNQFWTLSRIPKKLQVGDRIYFVKNGKIKSSIRVIEIIENSTMICETTGKTVKGFQSFRYKWW